MKKKLAVKNEYMGVKCLLVVNTIPLPMIGIKFNVYFYLR